AYDDNGKELRRSPVVFNSKREKVIDLIINDGSVLPSEYEILVNEITPLMQNVPLNELNNDDIYFLAGDTNQPIQRIRLIVEGGKRNVESENGLPIYMFYGLFRQDLPTTLNE